MPNPLPSEYEPYGIYVRANTTHVLGGGTDEEDEADSKPRALCFNCGHDEHTVKECPFRRDQELIDLSRQYYKFYQGTLGLANWERVHVAEGWRQTRLNWLETFEPGRIKGEVLLDALGHQEEGEWLRNMAIWGYPKGWVSERNPVELVRERIWKEHGGDTVTELDDSEPFIIHGEDDSEVVDFDSAFQQIVHPSVSSPSDQSEAVSVKRWAKYPASYFLSDLLPVHTGFNLPPLEEESYPIPPPPPTEPPPLPPPPPASPPPPLPPLPPGLDINDDNGNENSDMELSDSD